MYFKFLNMCGGVCACVCCVLTAKDRTKEKNFLSRTQMITTNKQCETVQRQYVIFMHATCVSVCLCVCVIVYGNYVSVRLLTPICDRCRSYCFVRFCARRRRDRRHIYKYFALCYIFIFFSKKKTK